MSKIAEIKIAFSASKLGPMYKADFDAKATEYITYLLEQMEQQPELWDCPSCGFTFDAGHEDIDPVTGKGNGNYTCPLCELDEVEQERDRLRKELEECATLIEQQGREMNRLQNMTNKQLLEINSLRIELEEAKRQRDTAKNLMEHAKSEYLGQCKAIGELRKELEEAVQAMSEPHKRLWFKLTNERNQYESLLTENLRLSKKLAKAEEVLNIVRNLANQPIGVFGEGFGWDFHYKNLKKDLQKVVGQEGEGNQDDKA